MQLRIQNANYAMMYDKRGVGLPNLVHNIYVIAYLCT